MSKETEAAKSRGDDRTNQIPFQHAAIIQTETEASILLGKEQPVKGIRQGRNYAAEALEGKKAKKIPARLGAKRKAAESD
jgi:hypothetical protein